MAIVMQMDPDQGFMKQEAEPAIPKLNLPYTNEQCEPLPKDSVAYGKEEGDGDLEMSELRQKTDGAEVSDKGAEVAKDGAKAEVQKKAAKDESRENIEID